MAQSHEVSTGRRDRTGALRSVRVPTLVLHGDADRLVDPSGGRHLASPIPGARLELMAGMGHDYPRSTGSAG